jgi:sec-independent protein translocase protein TatA
MSLGIGQILIILVIVLIIFGAGKLPKVMADLGKGLKAFKDGMNEEQEETETTPKLKQSKGKNA